MNKKQYAMPILTPDREKLDMILNRNVIKISMKNASPLQTFP